MSVFISLHNLFSLCKVEEINEFLHNRTYNVLIFIYNGINNDIINFNVQSPQQVHALA